MSNASDSTGPMNLNNPSKPASRKGEDGLEFEVSEAHDDSRELAGGYRPAGDSDSKGEREPTSPPTRRSVAVALDDEDPIVESPIGSTAANEAAMGESVLTRKEAPVAAKLPASPVGATGSTTRSAAGEKSHERSVPKLTDAQVKAVESSLAKKHDYLDEKEQRELLKRIQDNPSSAVAHTPTSTHPTSEEPARSRHSVVPFDDEPGARPKMAERARGVAYFFNNVIQLSGHAELHEQELLSIGDRHYTLRKRRLSRQTMAIVFGSVFGLVLLVVGISFMAGSGSDKGWVVGMALNEYDQPYIQGATVRFPDLNISLTSNGEGFFKTDALPSGSHRVEYIMAGSVIGEDFVTVVGDQITNLVLRPRAAESTEQPVQQETQTTPDESARPAQQTSSTGRVSLDAGVPDAKLILNGKTVGSGNLTFANITPGDYNYQIVKNGYETASGIISVQAGQTSRLRVRLDAEVAKPVVHAIPTPVRTSYDEGIAALTNGDFPTARTLFSQAISDGIAGASAYMGRAQGYAGDGAFPEAIQDYLSAAAIFTQNNQLRDAIGAYGEALELDGRSVDALLGRGAIFMMANEARAAVADYEAVTLVDRKNVMGHIGLGDARLALGDPARAQKHFKDARSLNSSEPYIYERLMIAYMATNDFKDVRKTWDAYQKVAGPDRSAGFLNDPQNAAMARVVSTGG